MLLCYMPFDYSRTHLAYSLIFASTYSMIIGLINTQEGAIAMKHSHQPIVTDDTGLQRFQVNAIVRFLLDRGPFNLDLLAEQTFDPEDEAHFAQLIGYSVRGWAELPCVTDALWHEALGGLPDLPQRSSSAFRAQVLGEIDTAIANLHGLKATLLAQTTPEAE